MKKSISKKLQNIPVTKYGASKDGKGCILFLNQEAQNQAEEALKEVFNVTVKVNKPNKIMPKIKIPNINIQLSEANKELKSTIIAKNYSNANIYKLYLEVVLKCYMLIKAVMLSQRLCKHEA